MPRRPPLRVATDADVPPPKNLKAAAATSERALLVMLRDKIAAEMDSGVPPHTLAPLARQLRDIAKEIEAMDLRAKEEAQEGAILDDEAWDSESL